MMSVGFAAVKRVKMTKVLHRILPSSSTLETHRSTRCTSGWNLSDTQPRSRLQGPARVCERSWRIAVVVWSRAFRRGNFKRGQMLQAQCLHTYVAADQLSRVCNFNSAAVTNRESRAPFPV